MTGTLSLIRACERWGIRQQIKTEAIELNVCSTTSKIRAVFNQVDIDGNGFITISELKSGLKQHNILFTDQYIYQYLKEVDLDGDGQIVFNEFSIFWIANKTHSRKVSTVQRLRTSFRELDTENDGYTTLDELKMALIKYKGSCTDEEVYKIMRQADEDGDGRISFDEFVVFNTCLRYLTLYFYLL
ncbi:neo-calmodulin-like [Saccoglossus kowalevskii]